MDIATQERQLNFNQMVKSGLRTFQEPKIFELEILLKYFFSRVWFSDSIDREPDSSSLTGQRLENQITKYKLPHKYSVPPPHWQPRFLYRITLVRLSKYTIIQVRISGLTTTQGKQKHIFAFPISEFILTLYSYFFYNFIVQS